jgi:hypothetical protein
VFSVLEAIAECQKPVVQAMTWADRVLPLIPVLTPFVAIYTFWLGWRQKENERCFSFYNEAVITPSMDNMDAFFEKYRDKFCEIARKTTPVSTRVAVPRATTRLITEFSQDLYGLKDAIVKRIEVFDTKAVKNIEITVEIFDTEITRWLVSKTVKNTEVCNELLLKAKRSLIRSIYKGKFSILR